TSDREKGTDAADVKKLLLTLDIGSHINARHELLPESGSDAGGRVDRERGHGCLCSRSLSKLLVSLSISSSFPVDAIHSGQVSVPLAPFALQMSSTCHPSPWHGCSPSPTPTRAP